MGRNEEGRRATPTSISIFDSYDMKTLWFEFGGSPPSLIPAHWNIGILHYKQAKLRKDMQHSVCKLFIRLKVSNFFLADTSTSWYLYQLILRAYQWNRTAYNTKTNFHNVSIHHAQWAEPGVDGWKCQLFFGWRLYKLKFLSADPAYQWTRKIYIVWLMPLYIGWRLFCWSLLH